MSQLPGGETPDHTHRRGSPTDRIQHGCKIFFFSSSSARFNVIRGRLQYNPSLICVCLPVLFHVSVMRKRKGSADHDSSFTASVTLLDGSSDLKQCHKKTDAASDPGGSGTAMGRRYRRHNLEVTAGRKDAHCPRDSPRPREDRPCYEDR